MIKFYYKINAIEYQRGKRYSLLMLAHRFRERTSSDPRDMVFGLLGLTPPTTSSRAISADYSTTTVAVYTSLIANSIRLSGDLFPLVRMREQPQTRMPDLPTWVPDWTAQTNEGAASSAEEFMRVSLYKFYDACKDTTTVLPEYKTAPSTLTLSGFHVDDIAILGQVCKANSLMERKMVNKAWGDLLPRHGDGRFVAYPGGGTYGDAFWRLLVRDIVSDSIVRSETGNTVLVSIEEHRSLTCRSFCPIMTTIGTFVATSIFRVRSSL